MDQRVTNRTQKQFSVGDLSCRTAQHLVNTALLIIMTSIFYCDNHVRRRHGVTLVLLCFTELIIACVDYVCVGQCYQNRGETLLGNGRVCFGDFKYQHWLPEISYPTFNIFKRIKTFIQQGCIKLIKGDSKDIYNITKDF